jgi:hypothetical protein
MAQKVTFWKFSSVEPGEEDRGVVYVFLLFGSLARCWNRFGTGIRIE